MGAKAGIVLGAQGLFACLPSGLPKAGQNTVPVYRQVEA